MALAILSLNTQNILETVVEYAEGHGLDSAPCLHIERGELTIDAETFEQIAEEITSWLDAEVDQGKAVHVFLAGPLSLGFYLGCVLGRSRWSALTIYHFDFRARSYTPVAMPPAGVPAS